MLNSTSSSVVASSGALLSSPTTVLAWTDERVALLRKLWQEGMSASRIAMELGGGVTRNGIIGKVHRLGLSGRIKAPKSAFKTKPQPVLPNKPGVLTSSYANRGFAPQLARKHPAGASTQALVAAPAAVEPSMVYTGAPITIMELRETTCRWPVGDPASSDFAYCGGKAPRGEGPYCCSHSRMAYQPAQLPHRRYAA